MNKTDRLKELILIILGNLIIAFAVSFLVLPNDILTGGLSGVAVALQPLFHLDPVFVINSLTIGLYIVGAIFLGKAFALKTLVSAICYPIFITLTSYLYTLAPEGMFIMEEYLASIYSGLIMGIGIGLVFRVNASTGGMDIPALLLHKYLKISSGDSVMIIDALTVLLGMFTYGLAPALVGVMSVFVSGQAIDKTLLFGSQSAKNVLIISDKWKEIRDYLFDEMKRGVTLLNAKGAYTEYERPVLMCVIKTKQYPMFERDITIIDPKAFIVVQDVHEVRGYGFTFEDESYESSYQRNYSS